MVQSLSGRSPGSDSVCVQSAGQPPLLKTVINLRWKYLHNSSSDVVSETQTSITNFKFCGYCLLNLAFTLEKVDL